MTGGILFMVAIRSLTHLTKAGISALRKKENTSHRYMRDKAILLCMNTFQSIHHFLLHANTGSGLIHQDTLLFTFPLGEVLHK
jgi:hypothetical protein